MGDLSGLMDKIQDVMPADQFPEFVDKLTGGFTLRLLYQMFQNLQSMGPIGQVSYRFIVSNLE
jgi:signal recognition particle subunit SRP54